MSIEIKNISAEECLLLRQQVLWPHKPQDFSRVLGDEEALHFGAFMNEELICVASIFIDGEEARLRKFATVKKCQGQGIGTQMIEHILAELKRNAQIKFFWCDARQSASGFYQRFGMSIEGERFFKSEVPYYKMSRQL